MNKDKHIPSGYKPSPLGPIPENWEVKRLGEVCTFFDSQRVPIKDADRVKMKGKFPYYGASGIIDYVNDYLFDDDLILLGEDGANIINRSTPLAFLVSGKIWVNNHAHVLKSKDQYNRYFVCQYLESLTYDKFNTGTAQPKLNREICENIPVLIPFKDEQDKIAALLSLWDAAIEKQTALIEKLTLRKRGLMQQLLTGKKRLKGFCGEWKEVRLGEICEIVTGKLDANAMVNNGTYPFYTCAKEIYRINEYAFDTEALLVSGNGEYVGYVHYYKGKFNAYQRTYVLDKFLENIFFLYYALNQYLPKRILRTKSNSNTPYIVMETLANMELLLPENNEQKAIASILINADKEIEIAKEKLLHLQEEKRGLMQVLLTGKKRVK